MENIKWRYDGKEYDDFLEVLEAIKQKDIQNNNNTKNEQ